MIKSEMSLLLEFVSVVDVKWWPKSVLLGKRKKKSQLELVLGLDNPFLFE